MFYAGATVRSRFHGLGTVVVTGKNPWVQFLDGPEMKVAGNTLTVVPPEEYDRAVANGEAMERWLDLRIYGAVQPRPTLLPRKPFDLVAAMEEPVLPLPPPRREHLDPAVLYFGVDEPGDRATGEDAATPTNRRPLRVTAKRVTREHRGGAQYGDTPHAVNHAGS